MFEGTVTQPASPLWPAARMATMQVHPESGDEPEFCAVNTELAATDADNHLMSFPVRRSIKNPTGTRRNFARRDWTSIGLRGARATIRKASTRKTSTLPGKALSHESRVVGFAAPAANPSLDSNASPRRDWRGLLWTALIVIAIAAAVAIHLMQ